MNCNDANGKKKIQGWLTRSRETLLDANTLHEQRGSTASIINRAFYAMLYAAYASMASSKDNKLPDDRRVMALFNERFVKQNIFPEEMGKLLYNAYNLNRAIELQDFFIASLEQAVDVLYSSAEFAKAIEEKLDQGLVLQ